VIAAIVSVVILVVALFMGKLRISNTKKKLIKTINSKLKPALIFLITIGIWDLSFYYTQMIAQFVYTFSGITLACMVIAKSGSNSEKKLMDFKPIAIYFKYLTLFFLGLCLFEKISIYEDFKF
jgi:hypothetical protein